MQNRVPITERAFQLARSGSASNVGEIKLILRQEGYMADALQGPALFRQFLAVIKAELPRAKPPA
jgi:hypothetical protein